MKQKIFRIKRLKSKRKLICLTAYSRPISKILDKYKSSFSSTDLSSLESLLSNDSVVNENYLLFTDGACEFDNDYKPINAGIGGVIKLKNKTLFSFSENVGIKTNNEAEYLALIKGVDLCIKNNALGGKISGAGGGGFLSIFAKKKHHKNIISAMKNIGYKHIAIKLESCGSKVIKF